MKQVQRVDTNRLLLTILAILAIFGCERRPLVDDLPDRVTIPISILWKEAGVIPQNVSVLIYDENDNLYMEHIFENQGDVASTKVNLPVGKYNVVVFNEKRNQIDHLHIRGHEKLTTLEAYTTTSKSVYDTKGRANGDLMVNQPGLLATLVVPFRVSSEMLNEFNGGENVGKPISEAMSGLTNLVPQVQNVPVKIKIRVSGLHNARMPALAELRNIAGGYFVGLNKNSMNPATMQFTVNNRKYDDGSMSVGEISTTISTLGLMGNRNSVEDSRTKGVFLETLFQLVDEERTIKSFSWNVTDLIDIEFGDRQIVVNMDLEVMTPVPLPDVKPEGGSDSGLSSEVVDWEVVDVPIEM